MDYIVANFDRILGITQRHLEICGLSLLFAIGLGIPLGIIATRIQLLQPLILGGVALIYTVPTLAMFGLMIPFFGLGLVPAVTAVTLYSLLPVVQNTYTGIINVPPPAREAALGLGMSSTQLLWRVELPLSLVVLSGGIRLAVVNAIGIGTLASLIGAGGLGDLIFRGISTVSPTVVLAGSIPVVLMALAADFGLKLLERTMTRRLGLTGAEAGN
ncbi:MAG: ABC transporter permease [Gemmobacter sp.]|jgi:osmoprotectant transport system permease protein|nr:ABC transporter permease [Gemmobacter sp.]